MATGQRGLLGSFMTTPSSVPHRVGWFAVVHKEVILLKIGTLPAVVEKDIGLHSGDMASNSTHQLGLCKFFINSLNPLNSHFLNSRTEIIPMLTSQNCCCPSVERDAKEAPLPFRHHSLQRSWEFRKRFWKCKYPYLLKMEFWCFTSLQNSLDMNLERRFDSNLEKSHITFY